MTIVEKANKTNVEKAKNMTKGFLKEGLIKKSRLQELLIKAMDWKDKQFAKRKQQLIDKVCEFIEGNISEYYNSHYNDFDEMNFINDLRKAMKGK